MVLGSGALGFAIQLVRGSWSEESTLPHSSINIGLTNHSRPFPAEISISHVQSQSSLEPSLRWRFPDAAEPEGFLSFTEETQNPVPRLEISSRSWRFWAPEIAGGSFKTDGKMSRLIQ